MEDVILQTRSLTKKYKSFPALKDASLTIRRGEICGLIGRNGAGKTTLMKIVAGLSDQTSGEYEIFNKDSSQAHKARTRIGCLIENPAFFKNLSAYQNLKYYAIQRGIVDDNKILSALDIVGLSDVKNKKFGKYSLGMKQKLGIAFAIMDDPDFLILDEPINGLDPIGIKELREAFVRLNKEKNITFIISSHILSELYLVASNFIFINQGEIIKEITKPELDDECRKCYVIKSEDVKSCALFIEKNHPDTDYKVINNNEVRIYNTDNIDPAELNKAMILSNIPVSGITQSGVSLEDYFKELIGEEESNA